ncbi:tRNA (guanosine(46)-N7)-methyltransferase TrmB [Streptomyces sp. NPDC003077]|uniref:tRNA (guanosine(46)-N7)-methyltransferase TrmB n=1 Tax=Streptomyces sp. NPDC003077 TaxID=3154443 RepID=UPI0033ACB84A
MSENPATSAPGPDDVDAPGGDAAPDASAHTPAEHAAPGPVPVPPAAAPSGPSSPVRPTAADEERTGTASGEESEPDGAGEPSRAASGSHRAQSRAEAGFHRPEPMFAPGTGPAADPAGAHHERRIRSFQPRRSRVSPAQAAAIRRRWPEWGLDIDGLSRLDLNALFDGRPVVLEIGFGMGEATAQMAAADPGTGILACDVHTPGQGNLLSLAERAGLTNVRVANGDAIILLREMLAPGSLAGLRVFFPDPWPKKRHHKRRLIQPEFIALASTRLAPGALVHCATDWEPYAEQMLEVLSAEPTLENLHPSYAPRPDFRPFTKFEGQGLDKGHVVHDLLFRRRAA